MRGGGGGWGEGVDGGCAGWLCGRLAVTLATHHNHPGPPTHTPRVHTSPPCTLHPPTNALAAHHIVCTKAQADADRQWPLAGGGGGAGLLPRRLEGIKVVMARLLVATSSVQPTSPWQDRTPCTTTHTHHTHKLGNFRSWHGEDQGSHAVGSGRVGRGAERRGWVKHGSPTWSVFEMCGGVELAAAKKVPS